MSNFWDLIWLIISTFVFIAYLLILFQIIVDLFRDSDLGGGFKSNYIEEASGEDYWISGCKRRGGDRMYGSPVPIEIDDDAREEYWCSIRNLPEERHTKCA